MPRAVVAVVVLVTTLLLPSCAGWALSSGSRLERAAGTVHSQLRTVALVAEAATRPLPATITLSVVLHDAESVLSEQASVIASRSGAGPPRDDLLAMTRDAQRLVGRVSEVVGGSVNADDRAMLDRTRRRLVALAGRLATWDAP